MTDDLGLFEQEARPGGRNSARRPQRKPKARRRAVLWVSVAVVLALIGAGAWYGLSQILDIGSYDDYAGDGESDVVVEVVSGDSIGDIANRLADAGVVASAKAFVQASEEDDRVMAVQPGYYVMRTEASGAAAVERIVDPEVKVGHLQITPGTRIDDLTKEDGGVIPGIVSQLSEASCAELNGESTCVPVPKLRKVARKADLAELGVPDWAVPDAERAEPKRRLEGLVMPGVYDVEPGASAEQLWHQLISSSAVKLQAAGMPTVAQDSGFTPYQVLTMASLLEREAIESDFAKVSRVTYNRLAESMQLEYDSTINYVLDRPAIRTTSTDRAKPGPYNTYLNTGLPPTPIAAASQEALEAAAAPEKGPWLFFVRCQKDGTSCFAKTLSGHQANVQKAQERDAY